MNTRNNLTKCNLWKHRKIIVIFMFIDSNASHHITWWLCFVNKCVFLEAAQLIIVDVIKGVGQMQASIWGGSTCSIKLKCSWRTVKPRNFINIYGVTPSFVDIKLNCSIGYFKENCKSWNILKSQYHNEAFV